MKTTFKVTAHGLQIDKAAILPGSTLILSRPAPGHWDSFGESSMSQEKKMVVATPDAANTGSDDDAVALMNKAAVTKRLDDLGVEYDGRKSLDDLRKILTDALKD